jgi:lauroyl/myristoyl acyltransferase
MTVVGDFARAVLEEVVRGGLPPEEPEVLRVFAALGSRVVRGHPGPIAEEVRRTFALSVRTAESVAREATDLAAQARLEALLLPRMRPADVAAVVRVSGEVAGPAVVVYPHAGNLLLLVTAIAWQSPGLVVFTGARAPERSAAKRWAATRQAAFEERLPIRWEHDSDAIAGWLAKGHVVACAFDDRAFRRFDAVPFLGRTALLSPEPWEAAARAGVRVVPATIRRDRDKTSQLVLGPPLPPDRAAYLRDHAEPWLRANPGHYAAWLATCRVSGRPLFSD